MMKRFSLMAGIFLAASLSLFAGDVANFVNLGFSADGKYFMFGFYGIDQAQKKPYAELYTVDTAKNEFVRDGAKKATYDVNIEAGQDGNGGLFKLFTSNVETAKKFAIDHLLQGRLLYVLMNGSEPPADLSFRDFKTNDEYKVSIAQSKFDDAGMASAAFSLAVQVTGASGKQKTFTIGNPKLKRPEVKEYVIRQIFLSPDDKYLVALVEKRITDKSGPSVRYMIETAQLK